MGDYKKGSFHKSEESGRFESKVIPLGLGKELAAIIPDSRFTVVEGGHREGTASTADTRQLALDFLSLLP